MKVWEQYRADHKALLAWLRDVEKDKSRLRLRYMQMRMIPKTIQRIEVTHVTADCLLYHLLQLGLKSNGLTTEERMGQSAPGRPSRRRDVGGTIRPISASALE